MATTDSRQVLQNTARSSDSRAWWSKDTVAVVSGANKGIGLGMVRRLAEEGITVILTARNSGRGEATVDDLKASGLESVVFHQLDILSAESINALAAWLKDKFGGIDILINNAGTVAPSFNYEYACNTVGTNYSGTKNLTTALLPLMRASPTGARIVNVTSRTGLYERLGSEFVKEKFRNEEKYSEELVDSLATEYLDDVKAGRSDDKWIRSTPGYLAMYSESKMLLSLYTAALGKSLSKSEASRDQIFVAAFCPGLVQTDMLDFARNEGYNPPPDIPRKTVEEGADTGVWLALLPKNEWPEKCGRLFGERKEYPFGIKIPQHVVY